VSCVFVVTPSVLVGNRHTDTATRTRTVNVHVHSFVCRTPERRSDGRPHPTDPTTRLVRSGLEEPPHLHRAQRRRAASHGHTHTVTHTRTRAHT
jgi:hypothetical protein